jgi:hypothetical protein
MPAHCILPPETGKYVGNRPIKIRKSTWEERSLRQVEAKKKKEEREQKRFFRSVAGDS